MNSIKVPMKKKPFTWSPTSVKTFKSVCQLKAWGSHWAPTPPPYHDTAKSLFGKKLHLGMEHAVAKNVPLAPELRFMQKWLESVRNIAGEKFCEISVAFDKNWKRTGYYDKDVWGRIIVDVAIRNNTHSVTLDYKSGKSRFNNDDQLKLAMISEAQLDPKLMTFASGYIYTDEDYFTKIDATRGMVDKYRLDFTADIRVMEEAHRKAEFEYTQNGLCKQYCTVVECPLNPHHHGSY